MSTFSYKAVDQKGKVVKGKLTATSEAELESKLKQSNLDLVDARQLSDSKLSTMFSTIDLRELVVMCIHLHHLEKAGVPLLDSIADLRDTSENPKMRHLMMDIYDSLRNGKTFSEALEMHPTVFDKIFVGLIKAGERTGNFAEIFGHLEHHYKWVHELRQRIKKATYYPIFLLFLMAAVIGMMMTFVIPKLTVFLKSQNIELPFYTTSLMAFSDFVVGYWQFLIAVPIILYLSLKIAAIVSKPAAYYIDVAWMNMPIIGMVIRKIEIARFCHFFAITYKSGIGILDCLESGVDVVKNRVMREAIARIKFEVSDGRRLTDAIAMSGEFPQLVVRMFKVGEDSGNLDQSLENINEFYDEEVNNSIDGMVGVMQPTLTIMMGGLMMWITIAVFGPIYGSFGAIGKNQ
jgi:type IV pilus assembly protein PilC